MSHSRAVPLVDGHHVLFVDDATGRLCIGGDQPAGSALKLSRKFVFLPPVSNDSGPGKALPTAYAAAYDLSIGIHVAVAFGDDVVLYSVPVDAYRYSLAEQGETLLEPFDGHSSVVSLLGHPLSNKRAILETDPDKGRLSGELEQLNMIWACWLKTSGDGVWPMCINGRFVGSLPGATALAVQTDAAEAPCVQIWAFGQTGEAKSWRC